MGHVGAALAQDFKRSATRFVDGQGHISANIRLAISAAGYRIPERPELKPHAAELLLDGSAENRSISEPTYAEDG